MSNKKAKRARQAERQTTGGKHKWPLPQSQTWVSKEWSEYSDDERDQLSAAGIKTEQDFMRVKSDGVRSAETDDFFFWVTNFGVGFYENDTEFVEAVARRLGRIEMNSDLRLLPAAGEGIDETNMHKIYAWNLKRGDRYFASPYSFLIPEGRIWLIRALKRYGISHLAIDTETEGVFDINDTVIIDLSEAA